MTKTSRRKLLLGMGAATSALAGCQVLSSATTIGIDVVNMTDSIQYLSIEVASPEKTVFESSIVLNENGNRNDMESVKLDFDSIKKGDEYELTMKSDDLGEKSESYQLECSGSEGGNEFGIRVYPGYYDFNYGDCGM